MATNAKKVDWASVIRLVIVVLTALIEVIGEDSEEKKSTETKSVDKE